MSPFLSDNCFFFLLNLLITFHAEILRISNFIDEI